MRFIDQEQLKPKIRHLIAGLEEAQAAVTGEADKNRRNRLIDKYRKRWTIVREIFDEFSYGKCWYVECKNLGSDDDVDHFRPKGGVMEDPDHPGYYWLAFDWINLRLSCHRANRPRVNPETGETGGKAEHFPLLHPAERSREPGDGWRREAPALLDPTDPADPVLLSFKPNGEVDLSPEYKGDPVAEAKFEASRICLHLNWPKFRDARVVLYNYVQRTVERGEREAPSDYGSVHAAGAGFRDAIRDLVGVMRPQQEYSAAARVYVESFKHVWWVRLIVLKLPT